MESVSKRNHRTRKVCADITMTFALVVAYFFVGCGKDKEFDQTDGGNKNSSTEETSEPKRKWPDGAELTNGYWPRDQKFWDKDLADWANLLSAEDYGQRRQAALVLGCYGEAAMPFVMDLLRNDEDLTGQSEAVRTAFYLGDLAKDARSELIKLLNKGTLQSSYQRYALTALHATGGIPVELRSLAGEKIRQLKWEFDAKAASVETIERFLAPVRLGSSVPGLNDDEYAQLDQHRDFVVSRLLEVLRGDDDSRKAGAARLLGLIRAEAARDDLAALVASDETNGSLRFAAVEALGSLGNLRPATVDLLRGMLDRKSPHGPAALDALGTSSRSSQEALPNIIELFSSSPKEVTKQWVGGRTGYINRVSDFDNAIEKALPNYGEQAVPLLLPLLKNESKDIQISTLQLLGRMQDEAADAVEAIAKCIGPDDQAITDAALGALVEIGRPALPALLDALRHPSPDVRRSAAIYSNRNAVYWSFRPNQRAEILSTLQETLKDDVPEVRYAAALSILALGGDADPLIPIFAEAMAAKASYGDALTNVVIKMHPNVAQQADELVPLLIKHRDSSGQPTRDSLYAIGTIGGPKAMDAVPLLREILKDNSQKRLHETAAIALVRISGHPDAIPVLFPPNQRSGNTAWVLAYAGPVAIKAVPNLRQWVQDYGDLKTAWALLNVSQDRESAGMIALMLRLWARPSSSSSSHRNVLVEIARLGGTTPSWFEDVLISALGSDHQEIRMQAAYALAEVGESERVVPMLVRELEKPWAQRDALGVLEEIGQPGKAAIPSVERLLNSSSLAMRQAARRTLQKLRGTED